MDERKPSIERIFFTDYLTSLSTIGILLTVGFFLFDRFIKQSALTAEMPFILALVCIIGVAVILWRIRLISSAFDYGWEVEGDILDVIFFRDRGRIIYIYTIQG